VERATQPLRSSEERSRRLLENSNDLIVVVNERADLLSANPAAARLLGLGLTVNGRFNLFDRVHPDDRDRAKAVLTKGPRPAGGDGPSLYRIWTEPGEWRVFEVAVTNWVDDPVVKGIVVNGHDVTERNNLTRALRTLGEGNEVLVRATDEVSLLGDTCRAIVEAGGYLLAWVGYAEKDEALTVRAVASAGRTEYLEGVHVSWGDDEPGQGPTGTAIRTGKVQVLDDMGTVTTLLPWRPLADKLGFRSSCALPLAVGPTTIGALTIYADEPGAFDPAALNLLRDLADDVSYGISRLRDAAALNASEERFRLLADAAPIGILETGAGGGIRYANPRTAEIAGRTMESLMGRGWVDGVHPDDAAEVVAFLDRARRTAMRVTKEFRVLHPDGEVRHVRLVAAPKAGEPDSGHVTTVEDITEEVKAQQALAHQAFYDSLTGLPNRALFLDRLDQELARGRRHGPAIAVLFLDLDRFKIVNDSLGHETGDAVLKELGGRFAHVVRAGETAARFSGDEFIFIIRDVHEDREAVAAAKRILAVLEAPVRWGEHDLIVNGSIGIVVPGPDTDAATVLRDADTAMYQAKAAGRDRYELFDEDLHRRSVTRLAVEAELRQALAGHEFEVYYQPLVEPGTGRPLGAEALVRWHHPKWGLVAPMEFIPVAEDSGLIRPLGRLVLEEALSQLARWDAQEGGPRLLAVAVNFSVRQLDDETSAMVRDLLDVNGVSPERLSLEVTESAVMADSPPLKRALNGFKDLGVSVAIDDFGTGYSSLAYLHTLPVTTLKIDRSFVERLGGADDSAPVVKAIVEMAHAMGLLVVAEGVSDERLRQVVAAMGCDAAQGFSFSQALPALEFAQWWREAGRRASEHGPGGTGTSDADLEA
jgi:diguanylate cyclase (GGDEF)-like protein/PAS domain S-box-containing protein